MESSEIYTPHWYAIQTRPQKETAANENLSRQGFETLYPREEVLISRQRLTVRPFFPRYMFARFPRVALSAVRSTRGVSRVVEFIPGQPCVVEDEVIAGMISWMRPDGVVALSDAPLMPRSGYEPDDLIMVTYGPLAGIAGLFKRDVGDGERVMLLLKMLGREFEQPIPIRDTRKALISELAYV